MSNHFSQNLMTMIIYPRRSLSYSTLVNEAPEDLLSATAIVWLWIRWSSPHIGFPSQIKQLIEYHQLVVIWRIVGWIGDVMKKITCTIVESIKTTSIEYVSTRVLEKIKNMLCHCLYQVSLYEVLKRLYNKRWDNAIRAALLTHANFISLRIFVLKGKRISVDSIVINLTT